MRITGFEQHMMEMYRQLPSHDQVTVAQIITRKAAGLPTPSAQILYFPRLVRNRSGRNDFPRTSALRPLLEQLESKDLLTFAAVRTYVERELGIAQQG